MQLIYQLTPTQVESVHELFKKEWWTKQRTLQETKNGINGSQICIAALDINGVLQGFCRVVTDYTFKAFIFDVIVSSQYRGHGLGNQLIQSIHSHPNLREVKHFELYCLPELVPFYEKHHFTSAVGGIQLMRLTQ
jgi:predicted GNAT family N-acyltransferase